MDNFLNEVKKAAKKKVIRHLESDVRQLHRV